MGLSWVVCGGESGPNARPFDLAWARSAIAQCRVADVAAFMKQLGARPGWYSDPHEGYATRPRTWTDLKLRDRKGGDWSEWPADLRVREFPLAAGSGAGAGARSVNESHRSMDPAALRSNP